MPPTDATRYPVIYRAVLKARYYDVELRKVVPGAFALRLEKDEEALSLLKEVGCSLAECFGGFDTCFGEFRLDIQSVTNLGLAVVDDDDDDPDYRENHVQITGIPTGLTFEDDLVRENLYTALADLASLHYDRKGRFA